VAVGALVLALVVRGSGGTAVADEPEVAEVARRTFASSVVALGAVKPQIGAEVRVGSRVSGRVQRLAANVGDQVEPGQVIAELETAEYDAAVAQRRAEVAQAEATAVPAEEAWGRYEELLRSGVVTPAEAEAALERHRVAQAQLESARAAYESAQVARSFASIRAPISGVVASVATQEGETVAAGLNAPTFLTILDLGRLHVEAYVDEVDIGKIAVGQRVTFAVDALPARDFAGRVAAVYPSATIQDNVVRYVTAVDIEGDYAGLLRPEMTANVRIDLDSRDVLAVPARAVRREGNTSVVHVLEDGTTEPRTVRIGWREGTWAEVVEGLAAGERILLDPPSSP